MNDFVFGVLLSNGGMLRAGLETTNESNYDRTL